MALLHRNSLTRPVVRRRGRPAELNEYRRHSIRYPDDRNPITMEEKIHKHDPHFPPGYSVQSQEPRFCGSPGFQGSNAS